MTLLTTDKTPPNLLSIVIASFLKASFRVFANLILLSALPRITKYFLPILIPSGVLPSSARTTTDSPVKKL